MCKVYIFLDFDGVTHPVAANNDFFRRESIEAIYTAISGIDAGIVISSTWRLDKKIDELILNLGKIGPHIIGYTPEINEPFSKHIRQKEIEHYISINKLGAISWVAIDDTPAFFRDDAPVYITDARCGFLEKDIKPFMNMIDNL